MYYLYYSVGQVSRLLDIPAETLRYYDRVGLISPQRRGENGYRYYYIEQFELLLTIKLLRAMGMPIEKIQVILDGKDLGDICDLFADKRKEVQLQQQYLEYLLKKIDYLEAALSRCRHTECIEEVPSPQYWPFYIDCILETACAPVEESVQQFAKVLGEDRKPVHLFTKISVISRENLLAARYHTYVRAGIVSTFPIQGVTNFLPEVPSVWCVRKSVVIGQDQYGEIDRHYDQMKAYIRNHGLVIVGDSQEFYLFNQNLKHYIEIYIPVRKAGEEG